MSVVRIILEDGSSVVTSWDQAEPIGAARGDAPSLLTLTNEESVESLPARRVKAILLVDGAVPLPADAQIFRFAALR